MTCGKTAGLFGIFVQVLKVACGNIIIIIYMIITVIIIIYMIKLLLISSYLKIQCHTINSFKEKGNSAQHGNYRGLKLLK